MADFVLKYADASGAIHNQVAEGASEQEIRDRLSQQGFLVYSVKAKGGLAAGLTGGRSKKLNLEKFLIFNQQFFTLIGAAFAATLAALGTAEAVTPNSKTSYGARMAEEKQRAELQRGSGPPAT